MKIKCGENTNTFEILDDEGKKLNLGVKKATITMEFGEVTEATLVCYAKEIDVELEGKKITLEEYIERRALPLKAIAQVKETDGIRYELHYTLIPGNRITNWSLCYKERYKRVLEIEDKIKAAGMIKNIYFQDMIRVFKAVGLEIIEEKLHAST